MKVKLEGAGRSRRERMEARRAIPVPTDGLPPKLTTGGETEAPEATAMDLLNAGTAHTPAAADVTPSLDAGTATDIPEPSPATTQPKPTSGEAVTERSAPQRIVAEPKPQKRAATRTPANAGAKADAAKVKVAIFLSEEDAAFLEAEAQKIGGVTPEMLMRKLIREFEAPMLTLDPAQEPELKPAGKAVRKYRADLIFPVSSAVLARYRAKYDKLGAYSDGLLVRHEAVPAFRSHILNTVRQLGK